MTNDTAIATFDNARRLFEGKRLDLAAMLPEHLPVDKFIRQVVMAITDKPELLNCSPIGVYGEVARAAAAGLEVGKTFGQFYLVPFDRVCAGIVGYKGMAALTMRHPKVRKVAAEVVYKGDTFDYDLVEETLSHKAGPDVDRTNDKLIVGCWAMVQERDDLSVHGVGPRHIKYMSIAEIEQRRKRSRASKAGPWVTDYPAMVRKTVLRALLWGGTVPMSVEAAEVISREVEEETKAIAHAETPEMVEVKHTTNQVSSVTERPGIGEPVKPPKSRKGKAEAPPSAQELGPAAKPSDARPRAGPDAPEITEDPRPVHPGTDQAETPAFSIPVEPETQVVAPEEAFGGSLDADDRTTFQRAFGDQVHEHGDFDDHWMNEMCLLPGLEVQRDVSYRVHAEKNPGPLVDGLRVALARGKPDLRNRNDRGWSVPEMRAFMALAKFNPSARP